MLCIARVDYHLVIYSYLLVLYFIALLLHTKRENLLSTPSMCHYHVLCGVPAVEKGLNLTLDHIDNPLENHDFEKCVFFILERTKNRPRAKFS